MQTNERTLFLPLLVDLRLVALDPSFLFVAPILFGSPFVHGVAKKLQMQGRSIDHFSLLSGSSILALFEFFLSLGGPVGFLWARVATKNPNTSLLHLPLFAFRFLVLGPLRAFAGLGLRLPSPWGFYPWVWAVLASGP